MSREFERDRAIKAVKTNIALIGFMGTGKTVVGQLLAQYTIADINVDNPPMESIIARIYEAGPGDETGRVSE